MQTISQTFKDQLKKGYINQQKVEIYSPGGNLLADSKTFNVVSGSITVDGSANFQRYVSSLVIADATGLWVPRLAADVFSVTSSNEMKIYSGMMVNGVPEMLLQGIFGLQGADVEDKPDGLTITLTAYDRGRSYSRAKLTAPYTINNGTNTLTAINSLLQFVKANALIILSPDPGFTLPYQVLDEGADPWDSAIGMAQAIGFDLWMNWDGTIYLRKTLDPNDKTFPTIWTYAEGVDSVLTGIKRGFSNDEAFNGQIVTGENPYNITPARGEAWDTDPTSPTYYLGPYGKVPEFTHDAKIMTNAQAVAAATARLNQRKGATELMEFSIVPNHAHEVGDVVQITRAKSGVNSTYLLDKFVIGLGATAGAMTITTRQRRV
jgi:hypothetical protein